MKNIYMLLYYMLLYYYLYYIVNILDLIRYFKPWRMVYCIIIIIILFIYILQYINFIYSDI